MPRARLLDEGRGPTGPQHSASFRAIAPANFKRLLGRSVARKLSGRAGDGCSDLLNDGVRGPRLPPLPPRLWHEDNARPEFRLGVELDRYRMISKPAIFRYSRDVC